MTKRPDDSPFLAVIRVWAATAWADGQLVAAEAEAMRRLIALAPLDDQEKAVAATYLAQPVELDTDGVAGLDGDQKRGIYRAAVRLSRIDQTVAPEETAFLGRLQHSLGLDDEQARAIEASVQ